MPVAFIYIYLLVLQITLLVLANRRELHWIYEFAVSLPAYLHRVFLILTTFDTHIIIQLDNLSKTRKGESQWIT